MVCQGCGNKVSSKLLLCPLCGSRDLASAYKKPIEEVSGAVTSDSFSKLTDKKTPPPLKVATEQLQSEKSPDPLAESLKGNTKYSVNSDFKKINIGLLVFLYVISVIGTVGAFVSNQLTVFFESTDQSFDLSIGLFTTVYFLFYVATIVVFCFSLFRAWAVLQESTARIRPKLAVGLLFIPVFNAYWVFQSLWGWSKDYQLFVERQRCTKMPVVNSHVFLAHCVLLPLLALPFVNQVIAYFLVPTTLIIIFQMGTATNYIIDNNLAKPIKGGH